MSSIILFRYDRNFPVCLQSLRALRDLNPDVPIHGMFGGDANVDLPAELTGLLGSNWIIPSDDFYHKWKDGDLCVRQWYRDRGHSIAFDHVYLLEWDMLFLQPLASSYGPLVMSANYSTFFPAHRYSDVKDWFFLDQHRYEVEWLLQHLARCDYSVDLEDLSFGKMGGAVFCREFLDRFVSDPIPSYSNDEVRLSAYTAAFGLDLRDSGLARDARNIFFVDGEGEPGPEDIEKVKRSGGAVIHPVRKLIEPAG